MSRRDYAGGAIPTTSTRPFTAADVILGTVALVGWPDGAQGPFAVCLERGTPLEEKILCDTITGNDIHVVQRGYDGTIARDHSTGAVVEHVFTAIDAEEANVHVNSSTGVHGIPVGASVVGTSGQQTLTEKTLDLAPGTGNHILNIPLSSSPAIQNEVARLDAADAAEVTARTQAVQAEAAARTQADNAESLARANADSAHASAQDPHPQYLTPAEGRPIGEVTMFAGAVAPSGWLFCDGSPFNTAAYPALLALLGSSNTPDLRGRVVRGVGPGYAIKSVGGAEAHKIVEANLPPHAHSIDHDHAAFNTGSDGSHAHSIATRTGSTVTTSGFPQEVGGGTASTAPTLAATHVHSINVPNYAGPSGNGAGTSADLDTRDSYFTLNFIIRAA
ncbi:MAG: tail fiber protein [Azonexus sp.]